jgi:hypothetical protein
MTRMRMIGLALVAVFAMGAFAASSALALPEVGRCMAKAGTGKYTESNCNTKAKTLPAEKQFEFVKSVEKTGFTSAGGEGVLETASGTKVVCTTQSAVGKYDQDFNSEGKPLPVAEVESVVAKFNGCAIPALGITCNTVGKGAGEITTAVLHGKAGYIKKTLPKSVGQQLAPPSTKSAFAEFECGGGAAKIVVKAETTHNCIIAPVTPINTMSTTEVQKYAGSGGVQNPDHFETTPTKKCNLESNLNGGAFEKATQALETTVTNEEALEIKA